MKKIHFLLLLIFPLLMVGTALHLVEARGPFWLGSNQDPEYVYLLNALNLAGMRGVGHIDHPGTPVQVLGAVTIKTLHALQPKGTADLETDVLQRPEYYLAAINYVMVALNALGLLALGLVALRLTRGVWAGLWLQAAPFFSITLLQSGLTRVTPEPLLFLASSLAAMLILALARRENTPKQNRRYLVLLAVVSGFGIAAKVTFLPLLLIGVAALPGLRNKILYLGASVLSFVVFTLPIIRMYPRFFDWIYNLLTHSGHYGGGPSGMIAPGKYIKNLKMLLSGNPLFTVVLGLVLVTGMVAAVSMMARKGRPLTQWFLVSPTSRLIAAVAATQVAGLLMVAKHAAHHYLLPVLNLTGILVLLAHQRLWDAIKKKGIKKEGIRKYGVAGSVVLSVILSVVLFVAAILLVNPWGALGRKVRGLTLLKSNAMTLHGMVKKNYPGHLRINYYRCSSPEYALKFGNDLARSYHSTKLGQLYPGVSFYDIWRQRFTGFDYEDVIPLKHIRSQWGNKIVVQGSGDVKVKGLTLRRVPAPGADFYEKIRVIDELKDKLKNELK